VGAQDAWGNSVSLDFSLLAIYTNFFLPFIVHLSCFENLEKHVYSHHRIEKR
jgi:hypothetical protein